MSISLDMGLFLWYHVCVNRNYKTRIAAEWMDEDGYWIELKSGWQDNSNPTCHTIVENTKEEAHDKAKESVPCDCSCCKKDKSRKKEK